MEIKCVCIIVISILEHCLCCRTFSSPPKKQAPPDRPQSILNVNVEPNSLNKEHCHGLPGCSANDITVRYNENEWIKVTCDGNDLPPDTHLIWHQTIIGDITFSTPPQAEEYMPYSLKLHMDRVDNGSYVFCTLRYKGIDVVISKSIHFLLNSVSTTPGFGNFVPKYYNDTDALQTFKCQKGHTIIRNATTGSVKFYNGPSFQMPMNKSDNGTLVACGYFKDKSCSNEQYECATERIVNGKYIYLYKNDVATYDKSFLLVIIVAGAALISIIISLIITIAVCWWKNRNKSNRGAEESSYITSESQVYAELQLTEFSSSPPRFQHENSPYATIAGVLMTK